MAAPLKLYNTRTRKLELFTPIHKDQVGLYTCGPTVYGTAHLGNLRTYLFEDVLRRVLVANGYHVKHVMNVTDVGHLTGDGDMGEDKVEAQAKKDKKSAYDIAAEHEQEFFTDLERLNVLKPDVVLRATETIDLQIALIQKLEARGVTYKTSDGVYFDTSKFPRYGELSGQKSSDKKSGARVEVNNEKKNPTDFALWKFSKPADKRQMEWPSPWGVGFPGWHIECSAMSMHELGEQFDIHTGGVDHVAVHHENEIAQSEAATGKHPFVNVWMHGEFLHVDPMTLAGNQLINNHFQCPHCKKMTTVTNNRGFKYSEKDGRLILEIKCKNKDCGKYFRSMIGFSGKMAKSEGTGITLQRIIDKKIDPLVFRYLALQSHYKKPLAFTWESLNSASKGLQSLWKEVSHLERGKNIKFETNINIKISDPKEWKNLFTHAINSDLNTAMGLGIMQDMLNDGGLSYAQKLDLLEKFDEVLGLDLTPEAAAKHIAPSEEITGYESELEDYETARAEKRYNISDKIRAKFEAIGLTVEDLPDGTSRLRKK